MKRGTHFALRAASLALVYLAVVGEVTAPDLATAAAAGALLAAVLPLPAGRGPGLFRRAAATPRLVFALARAVGRGTYHMTLVVLGRRPWQRLGPVAIPRRDRLAEISASGVTLLGLLFTLTPGTLYLATDPEDGRLWFHLIDASDPEAFGAQIERFYGDVQRPILP